MSWRIVVAPAVPILVRALLAGAVTAAALAGILPREAADACLGVVLPALGLFGS